MSSSLYNVEIHDRQTFFVVDADQVRTAIVQVLSEEGIRSAEISVALLDDAAIRQVNRQFLGHDYPTDVISFSLNDDPAESAVLMDAGQMPEETCCSRHVEAELVVSTETALRESVRHLWSAQNELLLYVIHGTLHLCGYDDLSDEMRPLMRLRERDFLARWQLVPSGLEA